MSVERLGALPVACDTHADRAAIIRALEELPQFELERLRDSPELWHALGISRNSLEHFNASALVDELLQRGPVHIDVHVDSGRIESLLTSLQEVLADRRQ